MRSILKSLLQQNEKNSQSYNTIQLWTTQSSSLTAIFKNSDQKNYVNSSNESDRLSPKTDIANLASVYVLSYTKLPLHAIDSHFCPRAWADKYSDPLFARYLFLWILRCIWPGARTGLMRTLIYRNIKYLGLFISLGAYKKIFLLEISWRGYLRQFFGRMKHPTEYIFFNLANPFIIHSDEASGRVFHRTFRYIFRVVPTNYPKFILRSSGVTKFAFYKTLQQPHGSTHDLVSITTILAASW